MARKTNLDSAKLARLIAQTEQRLQSLRRTAASKVRAEIAAILERHDMSWGDVAPQKAVAKPAAKREALTVEPTATGAKVSPAGRPRKKTRRRVRRAGKQATAAKSSAKTAASKKGNGAAKAAGDRATKGVTYANPADPKVTWRGFGKRPRWFLDAIASGKTEPDLRARNRPSK
jgi:DNA-binding protein H-NS